MSELTVLPIKLTVNSHWNSVQPFADDADLGLLPSHYALLIVAMKHFEMNACEMAHCAALTYRRVDENEPVGLIENILQILYTKAEQSTSGYQSVLYSTYSAGLSREALSSWHGVITNFLTANGVNHGCKFCTGEAPRPPLVAPSTHYREDGHMVERIIQISEIPARCPSLSSGSSPIDYSDSSPSR
ncbi:hypothetical protein MMC11_000648 [Xylographa trunciseda]|nr:hypothetical protein [Xylographa trunciseda]